MERRLASGTGDARKIKSAAAALAETLPTASVLGDVDALAARLTAIVEQADSQPPRNGRSATSTAPRRPRARRPWPSRPRTSPPTRRSGSPQATGCARSSTSGAPITGLDRKTDDALWKRYSAARETFNRRRGSHFAELDRERVGARQAKEALCERAEQLADSTDWGATACDVPRPADRVEGRGPRRQGRRRRAVDAVQGRPGQVLQGPQRRQRRTGRRVRGERRGQGGAARPGRGHRPVRRRRRACRAAHHRRQVGRHRQGAPRAGAGARAPHAGRREEGPRHRVDRSGRDPGGAGQGRPVPGSRRAVRAAGREGRGCRSHQGRRAGQGQRHAVAGVGRGRRRRRSARSARAGSGFGLAGRSRSGRSSRSSRPLLCRSAASLRRSSSAASWTAVRDHTTLAQWKISRITAIHAMIRPKPGPGCGSATVWRDHTASIPMRARDRRTGQRDPGQRPSGGSAAPGSRSRR